MRRANVKPKNLPPSPIVIMPQNGMQNAATIKESVKNDGTMLSVMTLREFLSRHGRLSIKDVSENFDLFIPQLLLENENLQKNEPELLEQIRTLLKIQ